MAPALLFVPCVRVGVAIAAAMVAGCATGTYRPGVVSGTAIRPTQIRVEQRPLDVHNSIDMTVVVEADPAVALIGGARLASVADRPCSAGVAPTRVEVTPDKREASLQFRHEALSAGRLLDDATALDVTVIDPRHQTRCERVVVLSRTARWSREPTRRFAGLGARFFGALVPVDGERVLRVDLDLGEVGRRVGPVRAGVAVFLAALIHGRADPEGGIAGDTSVGMHWGAVPFVHWPLVRVWQLAVGPQLAYDVSAGWSAPHVAHGPRAGIRFNLLPPRFRRNGFGGPTDSVSLALHIDAGLLAIDEGTPTTPTLGVGLVVETF